MPAKKLTFEQSMARLEEIVSALEKGDTQLEEALALFEEGTGLMKTCSAALDKAEQKVKKLMKTEGGEVLEAPMEGMDQ